MALQNDTSRIQYNGNNSTSSSYAIPFVFFENAHIKCVVTSSAGVDTTLTLGSTFNVTGAGNANGGSLTTTTAVPTSSKVTIFREVPATQTTSYQEGGDFPAESHERALDKLTMIAQQTKRLADRALKVPESTTSNPPDIPPTQSGPQVLGTENGALLWKQDRMLPSYPGSQTQQLLAAPGSGGSPVWQEAPSIAVGPVTPTGAIQARYISDHLADSVNVKDFGAVGDGTTDDWLAIQRAIRAATANESIDQDAATLTLSDTSTLGSVQIPKLFIGQGTKTVFFPKGLYYISRPLVVNHGTQLLGATPDQSQIYIDPYGDYNAIESFDVYYERTYWQQVPEAEFLSTRTIYEWNANLQIKNLNIRPNPSMFPSWTRSGTTVTFTFAHNHGWQVGDTVWVRSFVSPIRLLVTTITAVPDTNTIQITTANTGATSGSDYVKNMSREELYPAAYYPYATSSFVKVSSGGAQNTNTVTLSTSEFLSTGNRIRFSGGNEEYTISSISSNTITVTSNFVRNLAQNEIVLICYPAQNGIFVNGGENCEITKCYTSFMIGAGMLIYRGSPAIIIDNCMSNGNTVAYWIEKTGNGTLIKPSGDNNYIFLKFGSVSRTGSVVVTGIKYESYGSTEGVYGTLNADFPARCVIQAYSEGSPDSCLTVIGGTLGVGGGISARKNRSFMEGYRVAGAFQYNFIGLQDNYGDYVVTMRNKKTDALLYQRGRASTSEATNVFGGKQLNIDGTDPHSIFQEAAASIKAYVPSDGQNMLNGGGILGDAGTFFYQDVEFDRIGDGTVMQFTIPNHNLVVGDYVSLTNSQNYSPWIGYTGASTGDPAYYNGAYFKVQSVGTGADIDKFTITVLNQGPTTGTCHVAAMRYFWFHQIRSGAHIIQMPNDRSAYTDKSLFKLLSRNSRTTLAGLNVPTADTGEWWAKDQFTLGGNSYSPSVRITSGADAPAANLPDGSLYLRTGGTADTTLYVRAGGAWTALTST